MTASTSNSGGGSGIPWRIIGWGGAALLLLLPLVTNTPWTASDYVFMGVLLGTVGGALELMVRKSGSLAYRAGAALAMLTAFLTVWVNAAVGMIGSEDNPHNLLFGGVLLIALIGAAFGRFGPSGMTRAMVVTAIAQLLVSAVGLAADPRGAVLSMGFAGLWLLAAVLFRNAARDPAAA